MAVNIQRIHFESDFDFILRLNDAQGTPMTFPNFDFTITLTTDGGGSYVASQKRGLLTNCFNDNGSIHVVCNSHGLPAGELRVRFEMDTPDAIYPDGYRFQVAIEHLPIMLVTGQADTFSVVEAIATLPVIEGKPLKVEDLTPEQIALLQKPATDAATRVDEKLQTLDSTEKTRIQNEKTRIQNENERISNENKREEFFNQMSSGVQTSLEEVRNTFIESYLCYKGFPLEKRVDILLRNDATAIANYNRFRTEAENIAKTIN